MNSNPQKNYDGEKLSSVDTELTFSRKDQEIENIPIHTMKKDLQNINNPQYFNEPDNSIEINESANQSFSPKVQDSRLRTSPFLSQDTKKEGGMPPVAPTGDRTEKIIAGPTPHTPSSWGKLVLITCLIFLLFAAGAGGYYFWMNKKSTTKAPGSVAIVPLEPTLALNKPNYLNIDISTGKIDLAGAIDKYIKEVGDERPTTPIEFVVADNQNNPIPLKDFASKSGIALTSDITDNLKDSFSLFIYLDESQPHIGLAIDSNDLIGANLKEALTKNETGMVGIMEPVYLSSPIAPSSSVFNTSYYGGAEIRFTNIEPSAGMSLDYTIFRDKLIIGTSKMTLRSIIDYITANTQVQGVEDVIENIPEEDLQNGIMQP